MASLKALFATAPRLKIYVNDKIVAFAFGFNVNVTIDVQPIFVIGSIGPVSLEPTMYNIVTGTMQIGRLVQPDVLSTRKTQADILKDGDGTTPSNANIADAFSGEAISTEPGASVTNSPLAQNTLFKHLDPAQILLSNSVDVQVFMKIPNADGSALIEVPWFGIQSCRISGRNTNISMNNIVNEPLNFRGLLALHTGGTNKFSLDSGVRQG